MCILITSVLHHARKDFFQTPTISAPRIYYRASPKIIVGAYVYVYACNVAYRFKSGVSYLSYHMATLNIWFPQKACGGCICESVRVSHVITIGIWCKQFIYAFRCVS